MQRNGGQEGHARERIRKAVTIMGQVWGIEDLAKTGEEGYGCLIN